MIWPFYRSRCRMRMIFDRRVVMPGLALLTLLSFNPAAQQTSSTPPLHASASRRLLIKNAMVIYGNAKPPYGPMDILVQDGLIAAITPSSDAAALAARSAADTVIDATGKYV